MTTVKKSKAASGKPRGAGISIEDEIAIGMKGGKAPGVPKAMQDRLVTHLVAALAQGGGNVPKTNTWYRDELAKATVGPLIQACRTFGCQPSITTGPSGELRLDLRKFHGRV